MARILSLLLLGSCQADFLPFAGVEELKPARLHPFCEPATEKDGHRWCTRSIVKTLEDGGDVRMDWKMHVNPDNILSLDTEAEHGVRVTKCVPGELEVEIPESHEGHMEAGKFIVGSSAVHGCGHLTKKNMYHVVKQVKGKRKQFGQQTRKVSRFHLATETLPHMAHLARHISFNFSYMPVEARDIRRFPEMRTDFGQKERQKKKEAAAQAKKQAEERRLGFSLSDLLGGSATPTTGTIDSGGSSTGGVETSNDVVNLSPKQVSNFGWNFDFNVNTTETPTFTIDQPGTKGSIVIRHPFVKAHAGCFLNFTSNFESVLSAPHVQWRAGFKGHGTVEGRVEAAMNSTQSIDSDPATYDVPASVLKQIPFLRLLQNFDEPVWFDSINQSVGNVPLSIEPGFQFQLSIYHKGPFSGYLAFGGSTHGTIEPTLHFDSTEGFWTTFDGDLQDTDVWPPMWMVFTEAFEMGIRAEPIVLIKGDFLGFNDAEAAIQIVPYTNITVQRDGTLNFSADQEKELIAYPVRVMGIETLSFTNKYVVKISANGNEVMSAAAINWGDVEYHDAVETYNLGAYTDTDATSLMIEVTLYEVTSTGGNTTLGTGSFTCSSFEEGACSPSPAFVNIVNALNAPVAVVELAVAHVEMPANYYGDKIKGIGINFPTISVNNVNLATAFPSLAATVNSDPMRIHLIHSGRTFISEVTGDISGTTSNLLGTALINLYPAFLETWGSCAAGLTKCENPTIELWSGATMLANGTVPPFGSLVESSGSSNLLAGVLGVTTTTTTGVVTDVNKTLPMVSLYAAGSTTSIIATVTMNVRILSPAQSSLFMSPALGAQIPLQQTTEFMWTIVDADSTQTYSFTLTPMQIQTNTSVLSTDTAGYRAINDKYLVPVASATQTISAQCQQRAMGNISASQMPCTFVKELMFNSPTFSVGDQMVILTQWTNATDGLVHALYSPPFEIVAAGTTSASTTLTGGRRLQESAQPLSGPARWLTEATTVPASEFSTNANVDDSDPNCAQKALKFNVGQGVMMRAEILSVGVPKDFPTYAGTASTDDPLYSTPWKSLGGAQPESDLNDMLPDEVCDAGMCSSMLPGCRQASFKQLHFPQLIFNFSRDYFYNETMGGVSPMVQKAMAWAFSSMPEAVTVMLEKVNEQQQAQEASTAVTNYGFGNYDQYSPRRRRSSILQTSSQTSGQTSSSDSAAVKDWWNIQRRLETAFPDMKAVAQDGRPVAMPTKLAAHQVQVEFKEGLPYIVDHKMVNYMMKHGYFRDHNNQKLPITGFYLREGGSIRIPVHPKSDSRGSQPEPVAVQGTSAYYLAAAACVAAGIAAAAMITLRLQKSNSVAYEPTAEADEAGLE
mmetsp:Transcript_24394/g.44184  ORF Transcript_24394/g.44184 Transcript_24394/m.44184 type:complete len:1352 (-) Transcript_24394:235-4290(-)|eukprot:CAMPEP_0197621534 /NCGR_PEP_ID=MMETSP1338-20131121/2104_1 /TAXON_ID=43686 ORGANISM="Pelagodinium beii, Strain RCC1491" /NCGR_SAMPLE_ID=MMETSP1338 /ASSEMBLY_ACC=CAM_ASM_000754 /LENGTH=1351 /DNA_ID=CAMNT_0043191041 /DNA_START=100 /DNA_END=4155 /DNA_ORIENTATION=-